MREKQDTSATTNRDVLPSEFVSSNNNPDTPPFSQAASATKPRVTVNIRPETEITQNRVEKLIFNNSRSKQIRQRLAELKPEVSRLEALKAEFDSLRLEDEQITAEDSHLFKIIGKDRLFEYLKEGRRKSGSNGEGDLEEDGATVSGGSGIDVGGPDMNEENSESGKAAVHSEAFL